MSIGETGQNRTKKASAFRSETQFGVYEKRPEEEKKDWQKQKTKRTAGTKRAFN